jgi:hypothetical protein
LAVEVNEGSKWAKISEECSGFAPVLKQPLEQYVGKKLFIKGGWWEECRPSDRDVVFE